MQVWRLQTNTSGGDIAEYCLQNNVAALGWALDEDRREILKKSLSFETFCLLADQQYEGYSSVKRLVRETQPNDIIWMRRNGLYYYARITSESKWKFDFSDDAIRLDATNQLTDIHWKKANEAGDESTVPGCLSTGFIRGSAFQRINKSGINEYSQMLYNMMVSSGDGFKYDKPDISLNEKDFWNLLQPDDAEDLLCMWLYKEKNYIVIPSTNKRGTELYECVLIDPNSEDYRHIYIQVKKGAVTIDASEYSRLNGEVYFLTTEGTVLNANKENYHVVNPSDVYQFAIDPANTQLIPEWVTNWIKFLTQSETENMDKSLKKGIMFDTNRSYSDTNEMEMLTQNRICGYGGAERYVNSFSKGDYVLYYSKGRGIIAIGEIMSEKSKKIETEKGLYHDVNIIVPANHDYSHIDERYISAREIKDILHRGFYFASTIKTPFLDVAQAEKLILALEAKYK